MVILNDVLTDITGEHSHSALLLAWYSVEKRDLPWRRTGDPYAIWVSEVMLQQTQVKTVIPYYERFLQRFPGVAQLGTASLEDVLTLWSGLGYYSRARRMWEGARYLLDQYDGKMPVDYNALLLVPGIGKYTAGAIASIAFGQSVAAIDGNVLRVVSRLLAWSEPVETARSYRHFNDQLMVWQPALRPGDFNQALMELGAMVCTPTKPDCANCPLAQACEGYLQGNAHRYPVKKLKAKRQVLTRLTFVLRREDQVFIQKRPSQGLLADLWEFPGVELSLEDGFNDSLPMFEYEAWLEYFQKAVPERAFDEQVQAQFRQGLRLHGPVWYTFSHRRWRICWIIIDLPEPLEAKPADVSLLKEAVGEYCLDSRIVPQYPDKRCWVSLQDLSVIPFPVALKAIVEDLRAEKCSAEV
ncbi:A/G-specific adenine glycosylase [Desulfosporosinus sp. BG]|uniref:A/G-specific adenine glycosylase n=1 Tax=Desulfosporosinus sp. BG TaxID=1633135 RepID=UPI0008563F7A|nr:A/G-specific adenine glycosylase [Desulfosporosinus sp. BG]ODA40361.1 A/G-specific adenine glycosylase [Desulfosporosinus sp. BG]